MRHRDFATLTDFRQASPVEFRGLIAAAVLPVPLILIATGLERLNQFLTDRATRAGLDRSRETRSRIPGVFPCLAIAVMIKPFDPMTLSQQLRDHIPSA